MALGKKPNRLLWLAIIAVLVIAIGAVFYVRFTNGPKPVDVSGCLKDGSIPAHTVVLIDQSDPFSQDQQRWVEKKLNDTARTLPAYGQASVVGLRAIPHELKEAYRGCSPGSPDAVNQAIANKDFIEFEWVRKFYEPMRAAANAVLVERTQSASPILEAIETIVERPDFTKDVPDRRIVIVSDMIQNSSNYSFFDHGTGWSTFRGRSMAQSLPDLKGVTLEVHLVPRRNYAIPLSRVKQFWTAYAEMTGADLQYD
jgi:hypothetical protein